MRRFIDGAIHGPIYGAIFFDFFSDRTGHVACYWKGYAWWTRNEFALSHYLWETKYKSFSWNPSLREEV